MKGIYTSMNLNLKLENYFYFACHSKKKWINKIKFDQTIDYFLLRKIPTMKEILFCS